MDPDIDGKAEFLTGGSSGAIPDSGRGRGEGKMLGADAEAEEEPSRFFTLAFSSSIRAMMASTPFGRIIMPPSS
jgi:hypothetical protein